MGSFEDGDEDKESGRQTNISVYQIESQDGKRNVRLKSTETDAGMQNRGLTDSQLYKYASEVMTENFNMGITVNSETFEPPNEEKKKGQPKFINLKNFQAKKANEEREERKKNEPKKTILEMYRTIGAVNGPGWRPIPNRPVLETSICLMMDPDLINGGKPSKLSPIERDMKLKLTSPWNTKKYSFNNSSTNRTLQGDLGIFPTKRKS